MKTGSNIYKRKDGRWEGRYKCGYTAEGKTKYRSVYGKSYSAVKELLDRKKAEQCSNISPCKCTVGELSMLWLSDLKPNVKESTYANYYLKLEKHILPYFSGVRYETLTVENLNRFIRDKLDCGLSPKYVADIVVIIKSVAKFGSRNYGYANRIEYVSLPKSKEKTEKPMLSADEQHRLQQHLLENISQSNLGILLSMITGIRIGELCALKWSDIDLEKSILTVSKTVQRIKNTGGNGTKLVVTAPKSRSSIREIPLPDFIIPILANMKKEAECFVLSGTKKLIEPRTMQYRFKSLLKKLSLTQVSFHANRHAFATCCISLGFDVKTLSEILGHSSVEITLNRYVHSSIERKRDCMKLLSDSFSAA